MFHRFKKQRAFIRVAAIAVVLGAAWLALPYWLFLLVALAFYFVPFFGAKRGALPFVAALVLAFFLSPGAMEAVLVAALFFLVFGIKRLIIVDRERAFLFFMLPVLFFGLMLIFGRFEEGVELWTLLAFAVGAFLFYLLARRLGGSKVSILIASLLLFEGGMVVLSLPLNFLFQTAVLFLGVALFMDILIEEEQGRWSRRRSLFYFSAFFVSFVLILASAPWGI